jgi:hypothetical protein
MDDGEKRMSISIHGGRRIDAPIGESYRLLMGLKEQAATTGRGLQVRWMARRAARMLDDATLKGEKVERPLHTAWCEMDDRQREVRRTQRRDPEIDFEFQLWLWPLADRTLVNVHTEQPEFRALIDGTTFVEDHAYWDNVDPDENVPADRWEERAQDWRDAWLIGAAASDRSLTMVMFNDALVMPARAEEAMPFVPSLDERLRTAAARRHIDEVYRAVIAERQSTEPGWKPEGFGTFFEAEGCAREDADRRSRITEELRHVIRPITAEDLSGTR